MIALFPYVSKNIILKWVGVPDFWEGQVENRAKCRKMVTFPGDCISFVPDTSEHSIFHLSLTKFTPFKSRKARKR